jgi:hypothetical protein
VNNLSAALEHAAAGRPVFPCRRVASGKRGAKSPLTRHGFKDASIDPSQIAAWWEQWPDALIALRTGDKFLVLDVDPAGEDWFQEHADSLNARRTQRTQRGRHLFYLADPAVGIKTGALPPGIDIRGNGGYIIDWRSEGLPADGAGLDALGPLPTWVRDLILDEPAKSTDAFASVERVERKRATLAQQFRTIATAAPGMHDSLRDLAAKFIAAGTNPLFAKDALLAIAGGPNDERTQARIDDIDRLVDSAFSKFGRVQTPQIETNDTATAGELFARNFPPIHWTIDNLLPQGIFLLAGPPKVGKSWLILQACIAVAAGKPILGFDAKQGNALYLALEDNDRRMQSRLFSQRADALDAESLSRFHYQTEWPRIDAGGADALDKWLGKHPDTRLVGIDLLENFRAVRNPKASPYSEDYAALKALRELSNTHGTVFLAATHTRKTAAIDPLEEISGTLGLSGGTDGAWVLKKARGEPRGELAVIGRDIVHDGAYTIEFSKALCQWVMVGETAKIAPTEERNQILDLLRKAQAPMSPKEITLACGRSRTSVMNMLGKLVDKGLVWRAGVGRYTAFPTET